MFGWSPGEVLGRSMELLMPERYREAHRAGLARYGATGDGRVLGRTVELGRAPAFAPTQEGKLLGHVHLGVRLVEARARGLDQAARAELVHAIACHHDGRAARTAEAAVLYHANQLDAVAATRPVPDS